MYENVKYKNILLYLILNRNLTKHVYHQIFKKIKDNHLNKFCAKF